MRRRILVVDDDPGMLRAVRRVLDRDDIDAERLVIGLSDTAALLRRTELPVAARGPLRDAAGLGVEELLSYPLDEAIFDVVEDLEALAGVHRAVGGFPEVGALGVLLQRGEIGIPHRAERRGEPAA